MSEMVDRVARALVKNQDVHNSPQDVARTAIEAMREPTEMMRKALYDFGPTAYVQGGDVWKAMLDAALK